MKYWKFITVNPSGTILFTFYTQAPPKLWPEVIKYLADPVFNRGVRIKLVNLEDKLLVKASQCRENMYGILYTQRLAQISAVSSIG